MNMTAATLHAEIGSARQKWPALLWIALLTALWIALTYSFPVITASGAPSAASRLFIHILIALGLWLGLERTGLAPAQRRNVWLAVMIPFTLWLAVIWGAAINGVFRAGISPIPIPLTPLAIFLPVIIGAPILLRSRRLGEVLDATRVVDSDGATLWEGPPLGAPGARPATVLAYDVLVHEAAERSRLHLSSGADAVDMESGVLAASGRLAGVLRVVADVPASAIEGVDTTVHPDGRTDLVAFARWLATRRGDAVRSLRGALTALRSLQRAAEGLA